MHVTAFYLPEGVGSTESKVGAMADQLMDFSDLRALFINTTLTRSPGVSHTQRLIDLSAAIMTGAGVSVDQFRAVDHPIATGVYPDIARARLARGRLARVVRPGTVCRRLGVGWPDLARR